MGVDIHMYLTQFNKKTNKWEEVVLYHKNEEGNIVPIDIFSGRDYELFDILSGHENYNFPSSSIHVDSLPDSIKEKLFECEEENGYYGFSQVNFADLQLYLAHHPLVRDYDWEDENTFEQQAWKDSPLKQLVERIKWILTLDDKWWAGITYDSDIKLIYWFDR